MKKIVEIGEAALQGHAFPQLVGLAGLMSLIYEASLQTGLHQPQFADIWKKN
jgi:hypothetical protein